MSETCSQWLMPCRDNDGYRRNIGAGVSEDGRIQVIGPAGRIAVLSMAEAAHFIGLLRTAIREASGFES